jgi:hypothetical protein
MTPEDLKVIQEAIYLRYCIDAKTAGDPPRLGRLLDAVDALIYACPECNGGGHTCPADGDSIPHGATDCGDHDETAPDAPEWIAATWGDTRDGDTVRLGEAMARIATWYRPTDKIGASVNVKLVGINIDVSDGILTFPPGNPVEILMDAERKAVHVINSTFTDVREIK